MTHRTVADPVLGVPFCLSGRNKAGSRFRIHTPLVRLPLFRDVLVPLHEAFAQLPYLSPQPGKSGVCNSEALSRIAERLGECQAACTTQHCSAAGGGR